MYSIKNKKSLRNCHKQEKPIEKWQLSTVVSWMGSWNRKDIKKKWGNVNNLQPSADDNLSTYINYKKSVPGLCYMLIVYGAYKNSQYYLCNFSVI